MGLPLRLAVGALAGLRRGRSGHLVPAPPVPAPPVPAPPVPAPPVPAPPVPASSADTPPARSPSAARPVLWRVAVPVAAAGAGALFVTSAVTSGGTELRGSQEHLPEFVTAKQHSVETVREDVAALEDRHQRDHNVPSEAARSASLGPPDAGATGLPPGATGAAAGGDGPAGTETAPLSANDGALLALAGLTPLRGPAVTVTLSDAPRESWGLPRPPGVREPSPNDLVVHQQDVEAVVNALWAGGAEAMTIMGHRVTTLTSVRCVGNTLLVQGEVYSPPFTISAIGDTGRLRAALDAEPGVLLYRRYVEVYHLGYRVDVSEDVRMPAYEGAVELRVARPGTAATPPLAIVP